MAFKSWNSYANFRRELARERRYIRTKDGLEFLAAVAGTLEKRIRRIKRGRIFWRAQLGHGWQFEKQIKDSIPAPFCPARMLPLRDKAFEGRVNPKGIPCVYLATKKETAMSEVRPGLDSLVSVAQFITKRSVKIIDCSVLHNDSYRYFFEQPSQIDIERAVWGDIDRAFSAPVTQNDDTAEYAPTQVIAELFRSEGYDGVAYKSSFGEGYNVALFDMKTVRLLNCSLFRVSKIEFGFEEDTNPYFIVPRRLRRTVAGDKRKSP